MEDWLREGLDGRSQRTRGLYEGLLEPVLEITGGTPLRSLSAGDVRAALGQLTSRYSTRSLQITRTALDRAIRHAQANDLVGRNVAALVQPPHGRTGRPSKSFSLDQAKALLAAAEGTRMHAYVALSLLAGISTEEARALRWDHVIRWVDDSGPVRQRRLRGGDRTPRRTRPRDRAAHGWTARAVVIRQLVFGRQALTRRLAAGQDLSTNLVDDPLLRERLPRLGHNLILQVSAKQEILGEAQAAPSVGVTGGCAWS